jgi:hypothetical protein
LALWLFILCAFCTEDLKGKHLPIPSGFFFDIKIFFCGGCYLPCFVNQSPGILKYNKDNIIYIKNFLIEAVQAVIFTDI